MNINSIKDAVNALAQSLQASFIFPAGLIVFFHAFVFLPNFVEVDSTSAITLTLVVSLTLFISYSLYAFNFPLIRLLEGYKLHKDLDRQYFLKRKRNQYIRLYTRIESLRKARRDFRRKTQFDPEKDSLAKLSVVDQNRWLLIESELAACEHDFDENFPPKLNQVLPTTFGNAIAAFEAYSYSRYGIDSIPVWPRLVPILKEQKYLEFVAQEKSVFDFLLNMLFTILLLSTESFYLAIYLGHNFLALGILIVTPLIVWGLYQGLIVSAKIWGITVRVAFDLYRHELRKRVGLKARSTFSEEYKQWQAYSQFLAFRPRKLKFDGFLSAKDFDQQVLVTGEKESS